MVRTITPKMKAKFIQYVRDASKSPQNLEFLIDNLGYKIICDFSAESLEKVEQIYWQCIEKIIPEDLSDIEHFANLIGQYLGEAIIRRTGAKWVQCKEPNHTFGQPCIDGFGGRSWDRVFPVDLARFVSSDQIEKHDFPGLRQKQVFVTAFRKAVSIHNESKN